MPKDESALLPLLRRLRSRARLSSADEDAVLGLPHSVRTIKAGSYLVREGDAAIQCTLIVTGLAYRHKIVADSERQILSLHLAGDFIDLQHMLLDKADHNVEALTDCRAAFIPREAVADLAFSRRKVGEALWIESLVDSSVFREWIANVGQRPARERIAHLLCEFGLRLEAVGLGTARSYELPMNQEQIADATGLTNVHVNRMLMGLHNDGLIQRTKRSVVIQDWKKLAALGDFDPAYLHLPDPQPGA